MYVDTSVVVKLYVPEPDSKACEATVAGANLVSSRLLYCEFQSALLSKVARGIIANGQMAEVWREFERDLAARAIYLVPLDDVVVHDASALLRELHPLVPLRALDALHLATYLSVEAGSLFTKDARMIQAAARLGVPLSQHRRSQ
jgi:predicted nucleic acid-binding protein